MVGCFVIVARFQKQGAVWLCFAASFICFLQSAEDGVLILLPGTRCIILGLRLGRCGLFQRAG